jgi:hypothetical protein
MRAFHAQQQHGLAWTRCNADMSKKGPTTRVAAASFERGEERTAVGNMNKRDFMATFLLSAVVSTVSTGASLSFPQQAQAKQATRVAGDFCPPSSTNENYVVYKPDGRATPSIRAGVISGPFYSFELPSTWSEGTILNILSGNFCMPKCDEPWIETIWESKTDGFCQLVVSPIYRLVSKSNATVRDLGPPEGVIESVGAFVTGNYLDSVEDVEKIGVEKFSDGREYYTYEIYAPYAKTGSHFGAAVTVKDDLVYLFVVGGNDKQWAAEKDNLMGKVLRSFQA